MGVAVWGRDRSQLPHVGRIGIVDAVANAAEPARIAVDIGEAHLVAAGLASYGDQQRARILAYQATGAIEQVVDVGGVGGYPPVEVLQGGANVVVVRRGASVGAVVRSEEHTSELQSLMRSSYAVFCLKKKTNRHHHQ